MATKIAFYVAHFTLRGTAIAIFDYARYSEEILGYEAVVIAQDGHPLSDPGVERRFASRFRLHKVSGFGQVERLVEADGANLFYNLKSGENDERLVRSAPNAVHAVFPTKSSDFHGERFAFVSEWLSGHSSGGGVPFVPHIVHMPNPDTDLRPALAIPASATVFGSYGGSDSFDIDAAKAAVASTLRNRRDAYFIFMNTAPFIDHERAIFLPGSADLQVKANFIGATDAMVHARRVGETFGLACGEFSVMNKPVITYAGSAQRSHIDTLGNTAILYRDQRSLEKVLTNFDRVDASMRSWDRYSEKYSPAEVMRRFDHVFVQGAVGAPTIKPLMYLAGKVKSKAIRAMDVVWLH